MNKHRDTTLQYSFKKKQSVTLEFNLEANLRLFWATASVLPTYIQINKPLRINNFFILNFVFILKSFQLAMIFFLS